MKPPPGMSPLRQWVLCVEVLLDDLEATADERLAAAQAMVQGGEAFHVYYGRLVNGIYSCWTQGLQPSLALIFSPGKRLGTRGKLPAGRPWVGSRLHTSVLAADAAHREYLKSVGLYEERQEDTGR